MRQTANLHICVQIALRSLLILLSDDSPKQRDLSGHANSFKTAPPLRAVYFFIIPARPIPFRPCICPIQLVYLNQEKVTNTIGKCNKTGKYNVSQAVYDSQITITTIPLQNISQQTVCILIDTPHI